MTEAINPLETAADQRFCRTTDQVAWSTNPYISKNDDSNSSTAQFVCEAVTLAGCFSKSSGLLFVMKMLCQRKCSVAFQLTQRETPLSTVFTYNKQSNDRILLPCITVS